MQTISLKGGFIATVSDQDFDRLSEHKWLTCRNHSVEPPGGFYAVRYLIQGKHVTKIWMHREILGAPSGFVVDHINGDGLDNRRENLRLCTPAENIRNKRQSRAKKSSKFKGVYPVYGGRYRARITVDGVAISAGCYASEIEAAIGYDEAALKYHGEFARTNEMLGLL